MRIKILTIGKKPTQEISNLIGDYLKRLPSSSTVDWLYFPHGDGDSKSSKNQESELILSKISDQEHVILLDETGELINNSKLSKLVFESQSDVCFVIGGAYGVSQKIKERANFTLSLSKLVFPHQIVRLILAEQLYRSYTISISHPYHHN